MKQGRSCDGPPALRWSTTCRCWRCNGTWPELLRVAAAALEHPRTGLGAAMAHGRSCYGSPELRWSTTAPVLALQWRITVPPLLLNTQLRRPPLRGMRLLLAKPCRALLPQRLLLFLHYESNGCQGKIKRPYRRMISLRNYPADP